MGLSLVVVYFNIVCFTIFFVSIILGAIYSKYLRDKVGYLSLPPIVGLIPLGGYAAFAPYDLFSSYTPWALYLMATLWQAGHILIYSPAHGLRHDAKTMVPAFIVSLGTRANAALIVLFFSALLALSLHFYLIAPLSILYLIIAVILGLTTLLVSLKTMINPTFKKSVIAFNVATLYAVIIFSTIALDIFLRFLACDFVTYILWLISCIGIIVVVSSFIYETWKFYVGIRDE